MLARLHSVREIALLAVLVWLGTGMACSDPQALPPPVDAPSIDPEPDIYDELLTIAGASVYEEFSFNNDYRRFRIGFEQPVDQADPGGPRFTQWLTLMHRDVAAPMVLVSTGYNDFVRGTLSEPAVLLAANQLVIEHRYFGDSRPQPADWSYLDIQQAAGDHHRVVQALQPLYPGRWISTGSSKGGMTSIFHRRFFPDDVAATIAYVAPLNFSVDDTRYESFFEQLDQSPDASECVQRVRDLQRQALLRRLELMPYFAEQATRMGYSFQRVGGLEHAFEMGVVELEWSFWQYQGLLSCNIVPPASADSELIADFVDDQRVVWTMSDQEASLFEAYYYQVLTELGYPSVPFAHLAELLQFDYEAGLALLAPPGAAIEFDPDAMRDIADWLADEGDRIILIYGANDPWSAGAMSLSKSRESYSFFAPEASHDAGLGDLAQEDSARAIAILREWAEVATPAAEASATGAATIVAPIAAPGAQPPADERVPVRPRLGL